MKKPTFLLTFLLFFSGMLHAQVISSDDLKETGQFQRRDLSTTGSRMVINPYDFGASPVDVTPSGYSDSPALPLNIGYLTARNSYKESEKRFGREFKSVLEIRAIRKDGTVLEASHFSTAWQPHALSFTAGYENGNNLSGYDFFYTDHTVVRNVDTGKGEKYLLSGKIKGEARFDEKNQLLIIRGADCKYAIAIKGVNSRKLAFYRSSEDFESGSRLSKNVEKPVCWSYETDAKENISIAISFAPASESDQWLIAQVKQPFHKNDITKAYDRRLTYWNDFLEYKIPQPLHFELTSVDNKGVTADDVRKAYYKAWVLLAQNVLIPEPGVFPYYQVVTGKASLWDEGHEYAPFSAAWESFVGMQLFGYIDSDISWSCLKGLLSLVDQDGMLGGESLPSRKAHTAWVLYELSGDDKSLREVYPALERYLNWRISQPRWIYGGMTRENEKDAEFVVSAIHDMEYMVKIAEVLDNGKAKTDWSNKRNDFIGWYKDWFWKTSQDLPVQHINHLSGRDSYPIQITTGLYVNELDGDYYESMLGLFYKHYDSDLSFAGFNAPKYPDVDFTLYGLIRKNKTTLARGLLEATIRDIVRANTVFAETYTNDQNPLPGGVRPSIFGMAEIIDFVLLKNGYMFTNGTPCAINIYPEMETGVSRIYNRGKYYDILHEKDSMVKITEPATKSAYEISVLPHEIKAFVTTGSKHKPETATLYDFQ